MRTSLADQSLCQIWGISESRETELRGMGFHSPAMLKKDGHIVSSFRNRDKLLESVTKYEKCRGLDLIDAVVNMFPVGHRVRLVHDYFEDACFLDIETDSASANSAITCITTILGGEERSFVRGSNLLDFLEVWKRSAMLVTFNGKRFDVPVIMKEFGLSVVPSQVDLMDESRHYGLRGGLKAIERVIGFKRCSECHDGMQAVNLWQEYSVSHDELILKQLIEYNAEDVRSLIVLYRHLLALSCENRGFKIDH